MNKIAGASIAALMCAGALAGCGGSDDSSSGGYCDDIKSATEQFQNLSDNDITGDNLTAIIDAVHTIEAEAPDDIKSSWTFLSTQFDAFKTAMDDAGVSMDDFSKLTANDTSGIDPAKLAELTTALQSFDSDGISKESDKITAQVKEECDIDMDANS